MFSPDKIEERKAVWIALSALFLDTDVSEYYKPIARQCAASPFSPEELEQMLFEDVMPVCGWNLLSVAGLWSGFDELCLIEKIVARKNPIRRRLASCILGYLLRRDIGNHWQIIAPMIILERTGQT